MPANTAENAPPVPRAIRGDMIPVKDRTGDVLFYVSPQRALKMLEKGYKALGTKTAIRAVQVPPQFDVSRPIPLAAYVGQRYSHKHETRNNPEGVWTLKHVSAKDRPVFRAVLDECTVRAA